MSLPKPFPEPGPLTRWCMEHPKPYRAVTTVTVLLLVLSTARTVADPLMPIWFRVVAQIIGITFAATLWIFWKNWLRRDQLDELAEHVARMGGNGREHFVWLMAYTHMSTPVARRVNQWLRTHDLRAVPREDMPDEIQVLDRLLEQLRP